MNEMNCTECGNPMVLNDNGTTNHIDPDSPVDGGIDYDADADHVALLPKVEYIVTYSQMIEADSPEDAARAAFANLQEPLDLAPILTVQTAAPDGSALGDEITIDVETLG